MLVKFEPPFQMKLVIASVSLLVLQATEKLLVVTVLLAGSITTSLEPVPTGLRRTALTAAVDAVAGFCAMAGAANVSTATVMAETTAALSVRDFFPGATSRLGVRSFVMGNLHDAGFANRAPAISMTSFSFGPCSRSVVSL